MTAQTLQSLRQHRQFADARVAYAHFDIPLVFLPPQARHMTKVYVILVACIVVILGQADNRCDIGGWSSMGEGCWHDHHACASGYNCERVCPEWAQKCGVQTDTFVGKWRIYAMPMVCTPGDKVRRTLTVRRTDSISRLSIIVLLSITS